MKAERFKEEYLAYKNSSDFPRRYSINYRNTFDDQDQMAELLHLNIYPEILLDELYYYNMKQTSTADLFGLVESNFRCIKTICIYYCFF